MADERGVVHAHGANAPPIRQRKAARREGLPRISLSSDIVADGSCLNGNVPQDISGECASGELAAQICPRHNRRCAPRAPEHRIASTSGLLWCSTDTDAQPTMPLPVASLLVLNLAVVPSCDDAEVDTTSAEAGAVSEAGKNNADTSRPADHT